MKQNVAYLLALMAWTLFLVNTALADSVATVAVLPLYQTLEPFLLVVFSGLVSVLLTWCAAQLQTRTSLKVSGEARAVVQQAATNAAGRILAGLEGNLASVKVDVGSPLVAQEVPRVAALVGDSLNKLNLTSDDVAALVTAKVGILQAGAGGTPGAASSNDTATSVSR